MKILLQSNKLKEIVQFFSSHKLRFFWKIIVKICKIQTFKTYIWEQMISINYGKFTQKIQSKSQKLYLKKIDYTFV